MRIVRLYVDQCLTLHDEIRLDEATRHRALNVLRLNKNSSLALFNGNGHDYACDILALNKKDITVKITSQKELTNEPALTTHLVLGISKSSHMDYAIQKTVEAGVTNIYPLISERTTTRPSPESDINKRRHWQRIIISACEQCGRATLPALHETIGLPHLKNVASGERGFILDTEANETLVEFSHETFTSVWLLVGPEGGLTRSEFNEAQQKGYRAITLGPRIMRTETAALSVIVCVQLLWGDLSKRQN